jgi:hypothetical protein
LATFNIKKNQSERLYAFKGYFFYTETKKSKRAITPEIKKKTIKTVVTICESAYGNKHAWSCEEFPLKM